MNHLKILFIFSLFIFSSILIGCNNNTSPVVDDSDMIHSPEMLGEIATSELSEIEIESLITMRQEEMLARDVYGALYNEWEQNIFKNIGSSEQTHMNAIKYLLDRYEIEDPIDENSPGQYESEIIQGLYDQLTTQGSKSLEEAFRVGATIEDLDIKDLEDFMLEIDNEDILLAYQNLTKGSRNHIRSFTRQLEREGGTYEAQFLTQEAYEAILGTDQENFMVDSKGRSNGMGGGRNR